MIYQDSCSLSGPVSVKMERKVNCSPLLFYSVKSRLRLEIFCIVLTACLIVAIVVILQLKTKVEKGDSKCPDFNLVISGGKEDRNGTYTFQGVVFPPGTYWKADGVVCGDACKVMPCIRKCCPGNRKYQDPQSNSPACVESNVTSFKPLKLPVYSKLGLTETVENLKLKSVSDNHFFILYGQPCGKRGFFRRELNEIDRTFLLEDGTLRPVGDTVIYLNQSQYCLESFVGNDTIHTFECFEDELEPPTVKREQWMLNMLTYGTIFSIPFLVSTFLVYGLLPQLHNLHGYSLMCHAASLTAAYTLLATSQLIALQDISMRVCIALAYGIQFTFLAAFFWLNIMSFDIWRTIFCGFIPISNLKETERKSFVMYSCYAWGCPFVICAVTATVELAPGVPDYILKPHFGITSCWFKGDAKALYFYIPIGVLVCMNILLFLITACRLWSYDRSSRVLQSPDSQKHDKVEGKRFKLYIKLFIVMGVNWVMEVVSYMLGSENPIWLVTDLGNSLQGCLIFFFLVCNRRTLSLLTQRFNPDNSVSNSVAHSSRRKSTRTCYPVTTQNPKIWVTKL